MATDQPSKAEAAERAAIAAIKALGLAELDAVRCWVASGCEGPQPRADAEARRVLTEKLMAAIAAREAAERAAGGHRAADATDAPAEAEIAVSGARFGGGEAA
jgi:hypothetical protein